MLLSNLLSGYQIMGFSSLLRSSYLTAEIKKFILEKKGEMNMKLYLGIV